MLGEQKARDDDDLYPNCDVSIWLRTCTQEVLQPISGQVTGTIPSWIKGSLLRNGPGKMEVGDMKYNHLFDGAALLHRFYIENGDVTYQNRFLQSESFKRNNAAQRIVVTEFGTQAVPDPCISIFNRISAVFDPGDTASDNAMISIYPFGDEYYTFTETPVIHKIDPVTLETKDRVNLNKHVGIINHTSHPHVLEDKTVFNLGMIVSLTGPHYAIIKFPKAVKENEGIKSCFEQASIVGTIPVRWPLHPGYMHTFGITENFFIVVEQPLSVSVPSVLKRKLTNEPLAAALRWYQDQETNIYLLNRQNGSLFKTFKSEAFFYLHIINSFEEDDHVFLDICCYKDPSMLDCMYVESLKNIQKNPDYAKMFRGRPLRFVLPLKSPINPLPRDNLVTIANSKATAYLFPNGYIHVVPELLCNIGCETPRINYEKNLGKSYRYFYGISSDVDLENPGTLIKVDIHTKTKKTWCEANIYPSEPIFVQSPKGQDEDDGIILSAIIWGKGIENKVGLLVLDACSWKEIGRAVFTTPGPVPKCLHGWFAECVESEPDKME